MNRWASHNIPLFERLHIAYDEIYIVENGYASKMESTIWPYKCQIIYVPYAAFMNIHLLWWARGHFYFINLAIVLW